jgi:putative hemolysin
MEHVVFSYADPTFPALKRSFIRTVETLTGQPKLRRLYLDHLRSTPQAGFFTEALRRLDVTIATGPRDCTTIPVSGPLVVVANHPYGVLDGLIAASLMEQAGREFRVLTHSALLKVPEARPHLLPVDFSGTAEATETNLATRAAARALLDRGGAVVVFPAGAVSTAPDRLGRMPAVDAPWQPFTAQLIQRARATVLPVYFHGQNSRVFQIASHLNLTLRLSLLFKEVHDRMGTAVKVRIGTPIPWQELSHISDRKVLIDDLRARTYAYGAGLPPGRGRRHG